MKQYYKFKMNLVTMNILALVLMFLELLLFFKWIAGTTFEIDFIPFLVCLFFWQILHEILHAVGFGIISEIKAGEKNITMGIRLESGILYCMCKKLINKRRILLALLLPLVTIGFITLIIGMIFNLPLLVILSLANIAGAIGDILMTIAILRMPTIEYFDLDDFTGFVLLSKEDLTKKKYLGLEIVQTGKYNKKMIAQDYRRITVSKISLIIMIMLFVALLIHFLLV